MGTFFICLAVLVGGYFIYSRVAEKVFKPDGRKTPAIASPDGVDKTPLPKWKAFLIELLNIAGTGPIFGAVAGALFGPIVFIWIVVGCLLGGAVHDFYTGMISSRNDGKSLVMLAAKYIGKAMKVIMTIFSILLLILVTAVFVVSPSSLLSGLTGNAFPAWAFMIFVLAYYLLATILPIDKVIGKAYPVFGILLIVMALAVIIGIMAQPGQYHMIELTEYTEDFSSSVRGLPWWPFMFTTVACGAVSGFHATQSPMIAKCIKTEKDGRQVFYGAMVAEGIIALIWAAAAMAFFKTGTADGVALLSGKGGGNSTTVTEISTGVLGPVLGSILAVSGVIICPITSGDTALRSTRLILGELLHLDQKKIKNRLILTLPLFLIIAGISVWNFLDSNNFNILWNWFAWANQALATVALAVCTMYLIKNCEYKYGALITGLPMVFMFNVVITYLFAEPNIALGRWIPYNVGFIIGMAATAVFLVAFLIFLFVYQHKNFEKNKQKRVDEIKRIEEEKIKNKYKYVEDFENLGFGVFVHFGLYSQLKQGEWRYYYLNESEKAKYLELPKTFSVKRNWAKKLVSIAKESGAKYITLTTRHHDGFSLYDTRGLNKFDAKHSRSRRDLVKEFVDECNIQGIKPFFYHTLLDWFNPDFKNDFPKYIDYLYKSIEILCTRYGDIGGFWFDGLWSNPKADWQFDRIYGLIRKYQPNAMIINNSGMSNRGSVSHPEIDSVTFERGAPSVLKSDIRPRATEMCETTNDLWGIGNSLNYKSIPELINSLVLCRKYNANFLLNVGPFSNGLVPEFEKNILLKIGDWIKQNKGFIYKVKPTDLKATNASILYDGCHYYAVINDVPMSGDANVNLSKDNRLKIVIKTKKKIINSYYLDDNSIVEINNKNSFVAKSFEYGRNLLKRVVVFDLE